MIRLILILSLLFNSSYAGMNIPPNDQEKTYFNWVNLLKNPGFELGRSNWSGTTTNYSVSSSSTGAGEGTAWLLWNATAAAQTLSSEDWTIISGYYGQNGVASCLIKASSGTPTHTLEVYDGTNIVATQTIVTNTTTWTRNTLNFIFPSSGTVRLRFQSQADEPEIAIDDCKLGRARGFNITDVSQARFIASGYFATTASCTFTRTNTALGAMADTDCPGPTVEVNPGPEIMQTTDANAPIVTVNGLGPGIYQACFIGGNVIATSAQLAAVAINDGTTTAGQVTANNLTTATAPFKVCGTFTYTSPGNKSFELYASSAANAFNIDITGSNQRLYFYLIKYPSSAETAYNPGQMPASWSGYHASDCAWTNTTTASAWQNPGDDASCTFTQINNNNFGTVASTGTKTPGITWTPNRAGRYMVCVTGSIKETVNAISVFARLIDASVNILDEINGDSTTGGRYPFKMCGIVVATSTAAQTANIQILRGTASAGTQTIDHSTTATSSLMWQIFSLDQAFPAPLLVNSVINNTGGVQKIIHGKFNCDAGSVITSQSGTTGNGFSAIGNISGGSCTVTIATGVFSATPYCQTTWIAGTTGSSYGTRTSAASATSVTVAQTLNGGGDATQIDFYLSCFGPP